MESWKELISQEREAHLRRSDRGFPQRRDGQRCDDRPGAFLSAAVIVLLGAAALALSLTAADVAKMPGFSAQGAAAENATEHAFRDSISAAEIMKFHRYLTSEPHPAGSARNNDLAKWMAEQWRAQGLEDVTIHEYDVLNSSPREISLEMIKPKHFRASLREDSYSVDPDTSNPKVDGAYLGYSASGEVTAPVVYAHSGNPEDYDYLRQQGIDVRGKIVLVRYSLPYSYRGFKAYTAEKLGAAAILIYSDPRKMGTRRARCIRTDRGARRATSSGARSLTIFLSRAIRSRQDMRRCPARREFRSSRPRRCRKLWACRSRGAT